FRKYRNFTELIAGTGIPAVLPMVTDKNDLSAIANAFVKGNRPVWLLPLLEKIAEPHHADPYTDEQLKEIVNLIISDSTDDAKLPNEISQILKAPQRRPSDFSASLVGLATAISPFLAYHFNSWAPVAVGSTVDLLLLTVGAFASVIIKNHPGNP